MNTKTYLINNRHVLADHIIIFCDDQSGNFLINFCVYFLSITGGGFLVNFNHKLVIDFGVSFRPRCGLNFQPEFHCDFLAANVFPEFLNAPVRRECSNF